jgi:hypothetical protein
LAFFGIIKEAFQHLAFFDSADNGSVHSIQTNAAFLPLQAAQLSRGKGKMNADEIFYGFLIFFFGNDVAEDQSGRLLSVKRARFPKNRRGSS